MCAQIASIHTSKKPHIKHPYCINYFINENTILYVAPSLPYLASQM